MIKGKVWFLRGTSLSGLFLFLIGFALPAWAVDVQISQLEDTPDPATRGGTINYLINVVNSANDTANNVTLSVPLPATTTFVSVDNGNCSHDGNTPGTLSCSFGNITGDGAGNPVVSTNLVIATTAATPGVISLTATVSTSSTDTNNANNTQTQNTTINDGADLSITKTDSADPVIAGSTFSYTVTVNNLGPNDASSLTVTDTLPNDVTYQSASGAGWSCSNAGQTVTCTRASLTNGSNSAFTINGKVTGTTIGNITNSVTVSASTSDPDPNNNTTTETTTILQGTDLSITKTASSPVIASQNMTFTLKPRNNGPHPASTVSVIDTLPPGFVYVSATGTGWSCSHDGSPSGGNITCTRGSYSVGATDDITVTATAPANGTLTNNVSISSATTEADNSNNSASVNVTIVPDGADLSLTKTKTPDPVAQGSQITSTLQVTNNGPQTTTGTITVVDTLDVGETYVLGSGTNWVCGNSGGSPDVVTCTYSGSLAAGAKTSNLTITTTATNAGTLTNTATVSDQGGTSDGVPGNNTASASVVSTAQIADLSITKTATTANANTTLETNETTLTYTLTVTNSGNDIVDPGGANDGVVIQDTVPGFVSGDTAVNATVTGGTQQNFTCTVTNAVVNCTLNDGQTFANGDTVTITITTDRGLFDGNFTNTATVTSEILGDNNLANNSSSVNVTIDPVADVAVTGYTITPGTTEAGTEATFVITIKNNGPSTAANVDLDQVFSPSGGHTYTLVSATPTQGSCGGLAGNTLTCNFGSLTRNQTETLTLKVRPDWEAGNNTWTLNNTATVSTTTVESNGANNTGSATLNVIAADLDLLVNKTDITDPVGWVPAPSAFLDNVIVYKVEITNQGPSLATGVVLTDQMTPKNAKQLQFLCDDASATSCAAGTSLCDNTGATVTGPATQTLTCNLPDLAANATYTRYLFFKQITAPDSTGDTHNNVATINSNETDNQPANDSESETTSVRVRVDLGVTKSPSQGTVNINEPFTWNFTVSNSGPGDSAQSQLSDTLPANMELTGTPTPSQGTCTGSAGSTSFTCDLQTINSGASATVSAPVRITAYPSGGTISNTASVTTFGVDDNPANDSDTASVNVVRSTLTGTVFHDQNNNGIKDAGESFISGVSVTLSGNDAYGNAVNLTTTTNASGVYTFSNLSPGNAYVISESQPANYDDGQENINGTVQPGSNTSDSFTAVNVPSATTVSGYNFGELGRASIMGTVWFDEDDDAVIDGNETVRIANVTLTLTGTDDGGNAVTYTTTTDNSGNYRFDRLRAGTYTITETGPSTYVDGKEAAGSLGGSIALNDVISNIVTGVNSVGTGYNFGEIGGLLSGKVYVDENANDTFNAGEPGISGVTLNLTGTDSLGNSVSRTTTTDSNGDYRFEGLPAANGSGYTITEVQPSDYGDGKETLGSLGGTVGNDTFTGIPFALNALGTGYNFGEYNSEIHGKVYQDTNKNGTYDAGEPGLPGVPITLNGLSSSGVPITRNAVTDSTGNYTILGIPPSDADGYRLTEEQPKGYHDAEETIGTLGGQQTFNDIIDKIVVHPADKGFNYNFGEGDRIIGTLFGRVFLDKNENGLYDAGEPGIPGVEIRLTGGSSRGEPINKTTITGSDGSYLFDSLPDSDNFGYLLTETHPANYLDGAESLENTVLNASPGSDEVRNIVMKQSKAYGHYNFAEISRATISGYVYHDENDNGIKDGTEAGIPNTSVSLSGTSDQGATVSETVVTDSLGQYTFAGLPPSDPAGYTVTETQPADWDDGQDTLGNLGGTAGQDQFTGIVLTNASAATGYNFGEQVPQTPEPDEGSVGGTVFEDTNGNGIQDAAEPGIPGVSLTLSGQDDNGNPVAQTTQSGSDGSYLFDALPPSDTSGYQITETQPSGYTDGLESILKTVINGSDSTDTIGNIVLGAGLHLTGYDFGEIPLAGIRGTVFDDLNDDGLQQSGEPGIENVTITLTGNDSAGNAIQRTTQTDASGNYAFTDLPASDDQGYTLTETQPEAYEDGLDSRLGTVIENSRSTDVIDQLVLTTGAQLTDNDFGERRFAEISGTVYVDENATGLDESEPGISSVTLTLTGTTLGGETLTITTETDSDGNYRFRVPASDATGYRIEETQPDGFTDGKESIQGTILENSDASDVIDNIVLAPGETREDHDFGEQAAASLAGRVWLDEDQDGQPDDDEPGIDGVQITLTGTDRLGRPVSRTAQTESNGAYRFGNLFPGTYQLTETQPVDWGDGSDLLGSLGGTQANDQFSDIVLATGDEGVDYNFGETGWQLQGRVYHDENDNGLPEEGEAGIRDVPVTLTGSSLAGTPIQKTVLTGEDGTFVFTQLPLPDTRGYTLSEPLPEDFTDGKDKTGNAGGTLTTDPETGTDQVTGIVPGDQTTVDGYWFGETKRQEASISGQVWFDTNHNRINDEGDGVGGWVVELLLLDPDNPDAPGTLVRTSTTDEQGNYLFTNLVPGLYEVRFRQPGGGFIVGQPISTEPEVDLSTGTIRNLSVAAGEDIVHQDLPLDPSGVVYDSQRRTPVSGATVTLNGPPGFNPATDLVGGAGNQVQVTGEDGMYQYLLLSTAPAGTYTLEVTAPNGYKPVPSALIPPCDNTLVVSNTPSPALVQENSGPPATGAPLHSAGNCPDQSSDLTASDDTTQYYFRFELDPGLPSAHVINNHIPVDPIGTDAFTVNKEAGRTHAAPGDLVPYTITIRNNLSFSLNDLVVNDYLPAGFKYVQGSARLNGQPVPAEQQNRLLTWTIDHIAAGTEQQLTLLSVIGSGVGVGKYANQAWVSLDRFAPQPDDPDYRPDQQPENNPDITVEDRPDIVSNIDVATVEVTESALFSCADVIGKVFDDANRNGYQDEAEKGLPNVRLATARGLLVQTDAEGRYHIACAMTPNSLRGSNFIIKLDPRSLPTGYRVTTENPRVIRLTEGKVSKANFGASIQQVVRITLTKEAFEQNENGQDQLKSDWRDALEAQLNQMGQTPSVIRLAYQLMPGQTTRDDAIQQQLDTVESLITDLWQRCDCHYPLPIEREVITTTKATTREGK